MMKIPGEENGDCRDWLAIRFGTKVSRKSHFRDIEFQAAYHPSHRRHDGFNLNVFEIQTAGSERPVLQRFREAVVPNRYGEATQRIPSL